LSVKVVEKKHHYQPPETTELEISIMKSHVFKM